MRFRHMYMTVGSILVMFIWLLSDPDTGIIQNLPFGAGAIATLVILLKSILYVGMLHLSRKALLDYIDLAPYFQKAFQTSEGSGRALMAVAIMCVAIALVMIASVIA